MGSPGAVAQLAESRSPKPVVPGSSPGCPAISAMSPGDNLASMAREWITQAGMSHGTKARLLALGAITLAVASALALRPGLTSASAACPHADARPHDTSLAKMRKAVTCLVNNQR